MKKFLLLIGQSCIGILLLILFLRTVNVHDFIRFSAKISLFWVAWAIFAYISAAFLRVWRFALLMRPIKRMKILDVGAFSFAAALINYLIPLRVGEVGRGWLMKRKYKISLVSGTMASFFDKVFDLLASLTLALVLFPWLRRVSILHLPWLILGLFGIILVFILIILFRTNELFIWLKKMLQRMPKLVLKLLDKFVEGFLVLRVAPFMFGFLLFLSIFGLILDGLSVYFLYLSFGSFISLFTVILGYTVFNLSFLIPAGPGYVGNVEFLGVFVFSTLFGLPKIVSVSVVLYMHLLITVVLALFGFISLVYLHYNMKKWLIGLLHFS